MTLPTTVQGIIAARLDALPATEREVIFDASVVGKIFWRGSARLGTGDSLDEVLDSPRGQRSHPRQSPPPPSRVTGSLLQAHAHSGGGLFLPFRAARRERHAAVARFVENTAGDRLAEAASLLAPTTGGKRGGGRTDAALSGDGG